MGSDQSITSSVPVTSTPHHRGLRIGAGYLFAAACLVWVFHDLHPQRVLKQMTIERWAFLAPAVFFDVLTYVLQGWRWSLLLRPVGRVGVIRSTQAIYAGLFTNEILPLRIGEGVRAFLLSRWLDSPVSRVLPSMVVERLLDALSLLSAAAFAAIVVPLPHYLAIAGDILGVVVLIGTAIFVSIVLREELGEQQVQQASSGIRRFVAELASGLRRIGVSSLLWISLALSVALLLCQGLATYFVMLAFGLRLPLVAGLVVLFVIRLGTAIPNAPANVGSFQFFAVVALAMYGVEKSAATAFSLVDFIVLTVPLWTLGLIAILRCGFNLASLRTAASTGLQS